MSKADIPPERFAEIQTILHLYFEFFRVNSLMGRIGAMVNARGTKIRGDYGMALMAFNSYYLDTFMGLINKGTPADRLVNPATFPNPLDAYNYWLKYIELLFDKKTGLLSYDVLISAGNLLFSAGGQTSHTKPIPSGFPEFLPSTIRGEPQRP